MPPPLPRLPSLGNGLGAPRAQLDAASRRVRARGLRHWIFRERAVLLRTAKTAAAAAIAWQLAVVILKSPHPEMAPLAAIITVQVTVSQSVTRAAEQTVEAVGGMLLALLIGRLVGLQVWGIAAVVTLAFAGAGLIRMSAYGPQIAAGALIVLALGNDYGWARVWDTLLGAAVGILINLVVIPGLHVRGAGEALSNLADDAADLLREMARGMRRPWSNATAERWLERAQQLEDELQEARTAVAHSEEALRLSPGRRRVLPAMERWRRGLVALESAVDHVLGLARGAIDLAELSTTPARPEVLETLAELLELAAQATELLGRELREMRGGTPAGRRRLEQLLEESRRLRRHALPTVRHAVMADDPAVWPVYGSMFTDLRRLDTALAGALHPPTPASGATRKGAAGPAPASGRSGGAHDRPAPAPAERHAQEQRS